MPGLLALTTRQRVLHNALNSRSNELATYYLGALHALENEHNPERFSQAAQSLRELFEKLPKLIGEAPVAKGTKNYNNLREAIVERHKRCRGSRRAYEACWDGSINQNLRALLEAVDEFVAHEAKKPRRADRSAKTIGRLDPLSANLPPLQRKQREEAWIQLWKYLEDVAHHNYVPDSRGFGAKLSLVESILGAYLNPVTVQNFEELDEFLKSDPDNLKQDEKDRLRDLVASHGANYQYFFKRAQGRKWLTLLGKMEFFADPPEIKDLGNGYVQFPPWVESQFLAGVAKEAPQETAAITQKIPATENPRVQDDIMDVALEIQDGQLSATLFSKVKSFAESSFTRWQADKYGKVISHWANHGAVGAALKLAKKVTRWRPDPSAAEKETVAKRDPDNLFVRPEPLPICDESRYEELLNEITAPLTRAAPLEAVRVFVQTLSDVLKWSHLEDGSEPGYDGSHYWCRRVDLADVYESSPKSHLVHALAQACTIAMEVAPGSFGDLDVLLRKQQWKVFSRIRWHLYTRFPVLAKNAARNDVLAADCYVDGDYGYEFAVMLKTVVEQRSLTSEELQGIFSQILRGPDAARYRECFISAYEKEPTEQEIQNHRNYLYHRAMFPFKSVLPEFPDLWQRYQQFLRDGKDRSEDDYCGIGRPQSYEVVPRSPISVEELEAKTDEEVIQHLNSWKPTESGFEEPSVSGMSGIFISAVKRNPDRFLGIAERLKLREPTYARDFLYFCSERTGKKESLPWDRICELGMWIVGHDSKPTSDIAASDADDFADRDWTSCREALARLFSSGFGDYPEAIPFELRAKVFEILKPLVTEFDPRLEGENLDESHGRDLINRAINSVRGEALHTLIDHALWIRRHLKQLGQTSVSMRDMPEVCTLLEARLDVTAEPSRAVRSVYGRFAPWLCDLDIEWFRHVCPDIFPESELLKPYWLAAWNTYVRSVHPSPSMFDALESSYRRAVDLVGAGPESEIEREATEGLGRHLIRLYWWGKIPLSGSGSLLQEFLKKANPRQRANVMNHVGRSLEKSDTVPNEITQRMKAYWEARLATAKAEEKPSEFSEELCEFAWWYRSQQLEEDWCLQQVNQYLEVVTELDDSTFLIEALADSIERRPKEVARCFLRAVQKMSQQPYFYVREEEAKRILRIALSSEDAKVRELGQEAQDMLLRLGRFEFKTIAMKRLPSAD